MRAHIVNGAQTTTGRLAIGQYDGAMGDGAQAEPGHTHGRAAAMRESSIAHFFLYSRDFQSSIIVVPVEKAGSRLFSYAAIKDFSGVCPVVSFCDDSATIQRIPMLERNVIRSAFG